MLRYAKKHLERSKLSAAAVEIAARENISFLPQGTGALCAKRRRVGLFSRLVKILERAAGQQFAPFQRPPTALGPVANTDTTLLIYGLFQKGRVLAQDAVVSRLFSSDGDTRTF